MIKGISQSGRYLQISGGNPMNPYISPGGQGAGMVRYNTNMNYIEVYDGMSWKEISSYANIGLTPEAESLLDWVKRKMQEEEVLISLPSDHPAVKIARQHVNLAKQALKEAEEQLKITEILSKEHDT